MRILPAFAASLLLLATAAVGQAEERKLPQGVVEEPPTGPTIVLEVAKGTLIHLPRPANTVFVADPAIADVAVKSPQLVYLTAKTPGETVVYAVDAKDMVMLKSPVEVTPDLSRLRSSLSQLLPDQAINVRAVSGNIVLSGSVSNPKAAQKAEVLANSIAGEIKGAKIVNELTVAMPNQVNLQVRIDEVDRNVLKDLGVNWQKVGSTLKILTSNPTTIAGEIPNTIIFGRVGSQALSAEIDALAQEGFITQLAAPNLTAMNGQTASFLVGGEFPVPVASSSGTAGFPTITVAFKKYGVQLAFTPTIIDATHLNLKIAPAISELTQIGAVSLPVTSTSSITIPALLERTAETTVELGSGESFALAGLVQHNVQQLISKVPALGDIPILGAAFRSVRFQNNETELVIIVTPYLVNPTQTTTLAGPTEGYVIPQDLQRYFLNSNYKQTLPPPSRGPLNAGGNGLIGPGGFQLQ
jgi:pilus assembly protein CpaC